MDRNGCACTRPNWRRSWARCTQCRHVLDSDRSLYDWATKQVHIALGNMMTAAALIGIDSCPVEGFGMGGTEAILKEAGVLDTEQYGVAVMAAFGYRVNPQPVKTRQAMEDVVAWVR